MPEYKNRFRESDYFEHVIEDEAGAMVGTIRIKPSSVLWKPANAQKFYAVSVHAFDEWIVFFYELLDPFFIG